MKRILVCLALFTVMLSAQKELSQDSTAVEKPYTDYKRVGTKVMGISEAGLYRITRVDSSGNMYSTEPYYDTDDMADTTLSCTTTWLDVALGNSYEKIQVYNPSTTVVLRIKATKKATGGEMFVFPSTVGVWSVCTDSLRIRTESSTVTALVNMVNRKRY